MDNRECCKSDHLRNFLASTYKSQKKQILIPAEQLKRTQRKLVKTLSNFSPKKSSDLPLNKVMSSTDVKREPKYTQNISEDELDSKSKKQQKYVDSTSESDSEDDGQIDVSLNNANFNSKTLNPMLQSVVSLIIQIFDFKEQHAWLKENAALKLLHRFTGTKQSAESSVTGWLKSFISDESIMRNLKHFKDFLLGARILNRGEPSSPYIRIEAKSKFLAAFSGTSY